MFADLRQAVRALGRSPGLTATAILTLALAIGANASIFGVVNGLLLRSLPVAEPHRLVTITSDYALRHGLAAGLGWSRPMWEYFDAHADHFGGAFAWNPERVNVSRSGGEVQPLDILYASGGFFSTLGVGAHLGRVFTAADDKSGGGADGPVAVISYRTWQQRYGGARDVIGSPLVLEGVPFTIVGVAAPDFHGIEVGRTFDAAIPLNTEPLLRPNKTTRFDNFLLVVMARLRAGQSLSSATAEIRTLQTQMPGYGKGPKFLHEPFVLLPGAAGTSGYGGVGTGLRQQYERPLWLLLVLVALVLVVACVNIANLLLARGTAERRNLSTRAALGASRWRLARLLLFESLALSVLGAIVGLPLASWCGHLLVAQLSTVDAGISLEVGLDWRVIAFTTAVTMTAAIVFGIAPAIRASRVSPMEVIKSTTARHGAPGSPRWLGRLGFSIADLLIVGQVALSLTLVVTAVLLVATFAHLVTAPLGFQPDRVLLATIDTAHVTADPAGRVPLFYRLAETVAGVPGVAGAAASDRTPLSRATKAPIFAEPGKVLGYTITPDFFDTYQTPLRTGRRFDGTDTPQSARVAIVNEAYVRRFFPDRNPLGELADSRTIVGVVADAVFGSVRGGMRPTVYTPLSQGELGPPGRTSINISIRTAGGPPTAIAPAVTAAITGAYPGATLSFRPLSDDVNETLMVERLVALLAGMFAGLTLLLASLGLYGATSYTLSRRVREIGIRIALGATSKTILARALGRSTFTTAIGVVIGLAAAAGSTRFVSSMLFGVPPLDMATFVGVSLLFVAVGFAATFFPAYRAARVDPLIAIRQE